MIYSDLPIDWIHWPQVVTRLLEVVSGNRRACTILRTRAKLLTSIGRMISLSTKTPEECLWVASKEVLKLSMTIKQLLTLTLATPLLPGRMRRGPKFIVEWLIGINYFLEVKLLTTFSIIIRKRANSDWILEAWRQAPSLMKVIMVTMEKR